MVEFLHVRKYEKRNKTKFYWGVVKVCVGGIWHGCIERFCLLSPEFIYILNYIKSLYIIFMLNWFKYFDQKKSDNIYPKMFQLHSDQNMPQLAKCLSIPILYTTHHFTNIDNIIDWLICW